MNRKRKGPRLPRLTIAAWSGQDLVRLIGAVEKIVAASNTLESQVNRLENQTAANSSVVARLGMELAKLIEENKRRTSRATKANATRNGKATPVAEPLLCHDGSPILEIAEDVAEGGVQ